MVYNITHLCAGRGREIDNDSFGLCYECEEKIQQADTAWQQKEEVKIER